jgi:hypothetical protein
MHKIIAIDHNTLELDLTLQFVHGVDKLQGSLISRGIRVVCYPKQMLYANDQLWAIV